MSLQGKDYRIAGLEGTADKATRRIEELEDRLNASEARASELQLSMQTMTSSVSGAVDAATRATASAAEDKWKAQVEALQTRLAEQTQSYKEQLAREHKDVEGRFDLERAARDSRKTQLNDTIGEFSKEGQ